jgi:hypothetical protein
MIMHGGATTFSVMTHHKCLFATLSSIKMTLSIMNGT